MVSNSVIGPSSDVGAIWSAAIVQYEATTNVKIESLAGPRSAHEILDESKQRETKFLNHRHDGSRLDRFRSLVSRSLSPIEMWGDVVVHATKTLFPPAEAIFAAARYLIRTAYATSADFDRVEEFFEDLASYLKQLQVWEHSLPFVRELEEVITEVFTSVLVLCGICTKYIKTKRLVKAFRALAGEDNELKTALDRFKRTISKEQGIVRNAILANVQHINLGTAAVGADVKRNLALTDCVARKTDDIVAGTDRMNMYLERQETSLERDRILTWLSSLDFHEKQKDIHTRHYHGTCGWFLESEKFKQWFDGGSNSTLWCSGIPGAGKSVMTSVAISHVEEHTERADVGMAYVYCDYKDPRTQIEVELISSVTRQLVEQTHPIPQAVEIFRTRWMEKRSHPTWEERVSLVKDVILSFDKVYLFVDALDECPERNRNNFLRMLGMLKPFVRLLMTSRPYLELHTEFSDLSQIDIAASQSDIQTFLESEIGNNKIMLSFIAKDAALKTEIINTILKKADGMFLVAHLQIALLCRKTSVKKVRESLDSLPTEIYDFYEETLTLIDDQSEDDKELAKRALIFISCAQRPLSVEELCHALSIGSKDTELDETMLPEMEIVLNVSVGLIRVDEKTNLTALVHHTLQEYFNQNPLKLSRQPELAIATACLSYLSLDVFGIGPSPEPQALEDRLKTYQFYAYASLYCGHHLINNPLPEFTAMLKDFLLKGHKLNSCLQVLHIPRYRAQGWHDKYPKYSTPLHLAALWGLQWCLSMLFEEGIDIDSQDSQGSSALQLAARNGHVSVAQLLCTNGATVNKRNCKGETALHWAARNGHRDVAELLLDEGADVMAQDSEGWSPLDWAVIGGYNQLAQRILDCCDVLDPSNILPSRTLILAAEAGNEATVQMLLNRGADVNWRDHAGSTALAWAVPAGHEHVVRALLAGGADVNAKDNFGNTSLQWSLPYPRIAKMLIERGADVDAKNKKGQTALMWSAQDGQDTVLQILLDSKADVLAQDTYGCTALHAAALRGYEKMVDILVRNGSNHNAKDQDGWTALHAAALRQHSGIVRLLVDKTDNGEEILSWVALQQKQASNRAMLAHMANKKSEGSTVVSGLGAAAQDGQVERVQALLETGIDMNAMDGCGSTALTLAAWTCRESIVQLLLEHGADADKRERNGRSALHLACEYGYHGIVQMLVNNGTDVNAEIHSWTPLLICAERGHDLTIEYLAKNGANVNAEDYYQRRALHLTAWYGYRSTIRLLLNKGADINATDQWGRTPLFYAIEGEEPAVVRLLLDMGANIESKMIDNATPLHLASYIGNKKIVSSLLQRGADINATTQKGYKSLHIATLFKHEKVAQLLLRQSDSFKAHTPWPGNDHEDEDSEEDRAGGYIGVDDVGDRDTHFRVVIILDKRIGRRLKVKAVMQLCD